MSKEFQQIDWDAAVREDLRQLLSLAVREDLGDGDRTSSALVPEDSTGTADVVARQKGVVAGRAAIAEVTAMFDPGLRWTAKLEDGQVVLPGQPIGTLQGPAGGLLAAERLVLNLLGRLSGIATLTRRYVEAIAGTGARIYDTRKTTPGWRRLEKYAVRCGGGRNHRTGLFDAILIKDNHLALGSSGRGFASSAADAVGRARRWADASGKAEDGLIVEVEVDTLEQFDEVLPAGPDIVLLDNMPPDVLREAVARRDAADQRVELEASGGVSLETVAAIAGSGVDRISVGALTHSAQSLDVGLDWGPDELETG